MQLRDYQIDIAQRGADIMRRHGMVYLAMEVRTGKTHTALHIAHLIRATRVLFVTKKKAISSIEGDVEAAGYDYNIDVINFEKLPKMGTFYDLVIVDEAHSLGGFPKPSLRSLELRRITGTARVIFLSGTPTPESYSQLYHQLFISMFSPWDHYRNFYAWAKEYVNVYSRKFAHATVDQYDRADANKVMSDVEHLFIRFSQTDAGFTELVEEDIIRVQMKPSTMSLIDKLKRDKVVIGKSGTLLADTEAKLMSKVHQISSGTVILDEPHEAVIFDDTKARYIRERFDGQKIAIFYKFKAEEIMLRAAFGGRLVDTPEDFNAGGVDAVYISQIQAGREGINLSTADALVMLNIDFSAVSYFQARARMQSKDRTTAAKLYWIFSEGGIEGRVYKAVSNKKDFTLNYFRREYITDRSTDPAAIDP